MEQLILTKFTAAKHILNQLTIYDIYQFIISLYIKLMINEAFVLKNAEIILWISKIRLFDINSEHEFSIRPWMSFKSTHKLPSKNADTIYIDYKFPPTDTYLTYIILGVPHNHRLTKIFLLLDILPTGKFIYNLFMSYNTFCYEIHQGPSTKCILSSEKVEELFNYLKIKN